MQKENKKTIMKKLINIIGKIITVLSVLFIAAAIYRLGFDFTAVKNIPQFILMIFIGGIIICITVFLLGMAWGEWLNFFSKKKNSMRSIVCVYAKANIGKYLPGNVMHYVERNMFAGELGISQKKIALSSILEIAGQTGIAVVIAFCFSQNQLRQALVDLGAEAYIKYLMAAAFILPVVLLGLVIGFRKKIKKILEGYTFSGFLLTLLKSVILYAIVLIAGGVILVALFVYMGGQPDFQVALQMVSAYIISWVLGFVVPGAPGGIGVREFVLTLLLGKVVGTELILTLSIMHRLTTIIGDFMAYLIRLVIKENRYK